MTPETLQSLKDVLIRLHSDSVFAFNRVKAVEIVLNKHADLRGDYVDALRFVQEQDVHRDFGTLLDKIQ
ncbi:MAG TPA: hypothetical protein VKR52_13855 [Terracidiphilus sp.]|nr:hypothetical protein [Terracidiphilus sp.]